MELDEARDRCSENVNKLAEAMSQVVEAISEILPLMVEMVSALYKQWRLEGRRQEEDRQKALELKLVSKRVVELSKSKRTKVSKKNMARIRKELRRYEKRK